MNQKLHQMGLLCLLGAAALLFSCLFFVTIPSRTASAEQSISNDATLTVKIEYAKALDCVDDAFWGCESDADFRAVVHIAGTRFESYIIKNQDEISPPDWIFSKPISLSNELTQTVQVKIELWDSDTGVNDDDEMDLHTGDDNPLSLTVNLRNCIDNELGAIAGTLATPKKCGETITSEGRIGNPANIRFQITADTPKDTFVVKNEVNEPVVGAEVRLFRSNEPRPTYVTDSEGKVAIPCLRQGDELIAMQLVDTKVVSDSTHEGWHYRTYITSLNYDEISGEALPYLSTGQTCGAVPIDLTVKKRSPLILFNLIVSVWWGAYGDDEELVSSTFLDRLENALHSASDIVFDVTEGQFAFGNVTIYDGYDHWDKQAYWDEADIQILPSNYMRPWAVPGGITRGSPYTYTSSVFSTTVFYPGYIRMGRAWDQGNNPDASLDTYDGSRMIAHEFMHYAFMLLDEYFYFDSNNQLQKATCPGSLMDDSYGANPELPMQGSLLWAESCKKTEQFMTHGESPWETIARIYSDRSQTGRWELRIPQPGTLPKAGPLNLPVNLTTVEVKSQGHNPLANGNGEVKVTVKNANNEGFYPGEVELFLLRKNAENGLRIYAQGTVSTTGIIGLVGVKANDEIVAISWDGQNYGAKPYTTGTTTILNVGPPIWQPIVTAYPVTDGTNQIIGLSIEVSQTGTVNGKIMATIVPLNRKVTIADAIQLQADSMNRHSGFIPLQGAQTLDDAFIWVGEVQDRSQILNNTAKQIIIPYTIGGSPDLHKRSNPPRHPASSDGYCQFHFPESAWTRDLPVLVLSSHNLPGIRANGVVASAPCYLAMPESIVDFPESVSLTIYYNRESIRAIDDQSLRILWWNEATAEWQIVNNHTINTDAHLITANITRPGLYVAMALPDDPNSHLLYLPFVNR